MDTVGTPYSRRSWYAETIAAFRLTAADHVLGILASRSDVEVTPDQRNAWHEEISILQKATAGVGGSIFLEFTIPRIGHRADAILISGSKIIVLEFKSSDLAISSAMNQAWDYALDLKNFHSASHDRTIIPIVVDASGDTSATQGNFVCDPDGVFRPTATTPSSLACLLATLLTNDDHQPIDGADWSHAPYRPTPTIIEAARALYGAHSVDAINYFDAGKQNLARTSRCIERWVEDAHRKKEKILCFVTGVPGAGKTLVGLDLATRRRDAQDATHAVYLSGNGPLVSVLQEALTRDELRRKAPQPGVRKADIKRRVSAFIQNIHHFRDDALASASPPHEHVVIFDEAQRAWTAEKASRFMRARKGVNNFSESEPSFLISCVDRHADWAVIVCLVGGGQEIHDGEAGIGAWLDAIRGKYDSWNVLISARLIDTEYAAGEALRKLARRPRTYFEEDLHLASSLRSFRAEHVSGFVKALLDHDASAAKSLLSSFAHRYPIMVTRDLEAAKRWIRARARGSERYGLVASSKAARLKPHAIDVRVNIDPVHWFLDGSTDTRSSLFLEDAATEFQVQGLELDWTCVTWDGDLRFQSGGWEYHQFRGTRWQQVKKTENRDYLRNAYRVLLTRARQGMVIFVPEGEAQDPTRKPAFYDPTFLYLRDLGIPVLGV